MATETPEAPEQAQVEALAQVTLTFTADGGIHMAVGGDLRPSIAWALSDFLRNVGDDMFRVAREEAMARLQAQQKRIVVPGSEFTRVPR